MANKNGRIYWINGRARGDFRDFEDVGGGREALISPGARTATTDPDIAAHLATDRVKQLEERRRSKTLLGIERQESLSAFAAHHLVEKARAGKVTDTWLVQTERQLQAAVDFFGPSRDVASIRVKDVQDYASHLSTLPSKRKAGRLSPGSQRHYLNSLSNLYRRAVAEECATLNPVAALMEKPTAKTEEAKWLEPHDAALLLEGARLYRPESDGDTIGFMYALVAAYLLTGGRTSEVLGLEVDDVSFKRRTVTFRPNEWRRLKTSTSHRSVPLHPQLEEILRDYMAGRERAGGLGTLLFPSPVPGPERMLTDFRKPLDAIAARCGWKAGEVRSKMFRHTYCSARLQTLDRGAPVQPWTVGQEMGHGGRALVDRVYGHLGDVRHRSEHVEFRVEQHQEALKGRVEALLNGS